MSDLFVGVLLSIFAGIINGCFALPTKYAKQWRWENIWAVWGFFGMFVLPWLLVFATVPDVLSFYRQADIRSVLLLSGFGAGFGLGQIFFGLGVAAVGIALNFAIAIGLSTALGSLVPLLVLQPQTLFSARGKALLLGVVLILVGIVACAAAGKMKERRSRELAGHASASAGRSGSFTAGLLMCILAGVGSPLINFGLAFGSPLVAQAARAGVSPASQANVIWAPLVTAAFVPYLIYCAHLWRKNGSWRLFALPGTRVNWLLGATMGLLWMGSVAFYGAASARMAEMGPILGWPLFMSVIIIASNAVGLATGEWKGSGTKALTTMLVGTLFLILGFTAVAYSSRLGS